MLEKPLTYRPFLLTLWQEHSRGPGEPAVWRFRLEDPRNGQRRGSADLEALVAAQKEEMAGTEAAEPESQKSPVC